MCVYVCVCVRERARAHACVHACAPTYMDAHTKTNASFIHINIKETVTNSRRTVAAPSNVHQLQLTFMRTDVLFPQTPIRFTPLPVLKFWVKIQHNCLELKRYMNYAYLRISHTHTYTRTHAHTQKQTHTHTHTWSTLGSVIATRDPHEYATYS